jgi:ATP-dependent RNA helicase SUPV3L1/SUV3
VQPAAAFAGGGFIVTTAMTSLTGCSGEEFASILRSLGYRMEPRPKPTALPPPAPTPEAVTAEVPSEAAEGAQNVAASETAEAETLPAGSVSEGPIETPSAAAAVTPPVEPVAEEVAEPALELAPAVEPAADVVATAAETQPQSEPPEGTADESEPAAEAATTETTAAPPPEMIEVWRPGRPEGQRRPRHRPERAGDQPGRREHRRPRAQTPATVTTPTPEGGAPAAAEPVSAIPEGAPAADDRRHFRGRHPRPEGAPDRGNRLPRPARSDHANRPPRSDRPGPGGRPDKRNRGDQPDRDPALRAQYIKGRNDRDRRDKAPDPDSPFAKLAALKAQLEADAKERR